jgi:hypothetical protein
VRGWKHDGLVLRQTVDAYIKKTAYRQTQKGEDGYQEYIHGCLLWTYWRPKSIPALMQSQVLPGVVSSVEASPSPNAKDAAPF